MNPDRLLIDAASGNTGLATRKMVRAAGLTDHQWRRLLRNDVWLPVVPGVWRHEATVLTWEMKVRAGAQWLGKRGALHGRSALAWWGIEGCETEEVGFLIARSARGTPPWLTLHTTSAWPRGKVFRHDGVRVCDATRAIIDAARTETATFLEVAIDGAIRSRRTAVPRLAAQMKALSGRGRNGIVTLRELLLDSGGESYLERRFLRLMRERGLPRPEPQVVMRPHGQRVIRVDFRFPGTSVIVEVSGKHGHASDPDRTRDAARRNELQRHSVVLEFTTAHVIDDPDYVEATLRTHLPPSPSPPGAPLRRVRG